MGYFTSLVRRGENESEESRMCDKETHDKEESDHKPTDSKKIGEWERKGEAIRYGTPYKNVLIPQAGLIQGTEKKLFTLGDGRNSQDREGERAAGQKGGGKRVSCRIPGDCSSFGDVQELSKSDLGGPDASTLPSW